MKLDTVIQIVIVLNITFLIAASGMYVADNYSSKYPTHITIVNNVTSERATLNEYLEYCSENLNNSNDKIRCMQPFIEKHYKYISRNDSDIITHEELFAEGGDCQFWSELWEEIFIYMDIDYERQLIHVEDNIYHQFDIAYSSYGYCRVDQIQVECFAYG